MKRFLFCIMLLLVGPFNWQNILSMNTTPKITEKTTGFQKFKGFFTFYWEEKQGKIWLEIDKWDTEFLYVNYLAQGIGSNDIGLDRGQIGNNRVVKFQRIGPKVLLIEPNYFYRATSASLSERRAVEESFAKSVLWGFEVAAEEGGRILIDASEFLLQDAHNIVGKIKRLKQGNYQLDLSRSAFHLPRIKNFPNNSEIETIITFTGDSAGYYIKQVVPTPQVITVHQHHSFVKLPDEMYSPRIFDPRAGFFGIEYLDFSTPIEKPIQKRFIARHRLEKKDPAASLSQPIKPIVYYVDNGAPEPIQTALLEGAQWWNEAFEAAGYKNAFQVKILPEGIDMLDIRYNVIQWVHRSTRGWSYGGTVIDPRTGEILKGHITLGSLRVRQDYLIAEGLLSPYEPGQDKSDRLRDFSLARLRQLSAHEVGHTLGLSHNFAASINNRASVMDYPHPLVNLNSDGSADVTDAYDTGIGEWDKVAIAYGYQDFPNGVDEKSALNKIINKYIEKGFIFISDQDARPLGGAHPLAHLWDNGESAIDELDRILKIRRVILENFSQNHIKMGQAFADLEEVFVPMYMLHRYQTEAAAKLLGGMYYSYAMRGDDQKVTDIVHPTEQRRALESLLKTISPSELLIPEQVLQIIPPRAFGDFRDQEIFNTWTGVTFDPLGAAESVANISLELILHPERAARLIEYHSRDKKYLGFEEVVRRLIASTWKTQVHTGQEVEIQRIVNLLVLNHLMALASDKTAAPQATAIASYYVNELKNWITQRVKNENDAAQKAHYFLAFSIIEQFQSTPEQFRSHRPLKPPAGPPIGMAQKNLYHFYCDW